MKLKLGERNILLTVFLGFTGTGALLYFFSHWIRIATPVGEQHHPFEIWLRAGHSAFSYAGLIALGYLIPRHILPGLKGDRKHRSGLGNLWILGLLAVTALGILYSGEDTLNTVFVQSHTWLGFALPVSLLIHLNKRRKRSR